jgi:hypothetical protein
MVVALLGPGRGQPAQGGADWTAGRGTAGGGWVLGVGRPRHETVEALLSAEQQGRGSSGRVRLDGAGTTNASRKGASREQEGSVGSCGCRARSSLRSARRLCWHLGATVGARGRHGAAGPRRTGPAWGRWRLDVGFLARVGTGSAWKSAGAAAGAGSRVEKGDARIWWSRSRVGCVGRRLAACRRPDRCRRGLAPTHRRGGWLRRQPCCCEGSRDPFTARASCASTACSGTSEGRRGSRRRLPVAAGEGASLRSRAWRRGAPAARGLGWAAGGQVGGRGGRRRPGRRLKKRSLWYHIGMKTLSLTGVGQSIK